MGKEVSTFAQELGWGEIFLHCSREWGAAPPRHVSLSVLPSIGHTQHSQEGGRDQASTNEDPGPWGLQQLPLFPFSLALELKWRRGAGDGKDRSGMKEMDSD